MLDGQNESKCGAGPVSRREWLKAAGAAAWMVADGAAGAWRPLYSAGLGVARAAARDSEVRIGHIHPLSGGLALEANEMRDAIRLAVEEVNEAGGIRSLGGARVAVLDGNSEGSPEKGAAEAERLIREGVTVLLGAYQSAVTYVATQVAERRRTPFVITVAVADDILERGFRYSFRVQPNARAMAQGGVEYLAELGRIAPVRRVALMHENSIFGTSIAEHASRFLTQAGFEVVGRIAYPTTAADLSTEVNRLKALNPDVGVFTGYFRDGVLVARTLWELRVPLKSVVGIANGAFSHPKFATEAGPEASEHVMDANYYYNPHGPLTRRVLQRYRERFGRSMSTHAVYAYVATRVAIDAIERAGSTDRDQVRAALATTDLADHILPQGPIRFDQKGENVNARPVLLQVRGGSVKVVLPQAYSEAAPVFPRGA